VSSYGSKAFRRCHVPAFVDCMQGSFYNRYASGG
jgi:hypothetical protein